MDKKPKKMVPEVRFKGFTDDWEQRKAKDLFQSKSEKGYPKLRVLSATQDRGMVFRDNSGIDIKYDSNSLANYKKIDKGDFVIHLRSFQGGFAYSDLQGIASPAYTVFRFKDPQNFDDYFWKENFSSYNFIQLLKKVTYGVRDGRSISYKDFLTLKQNYPTLVEQKKIGKLLKVLDKLLSLQQKKLEQLKLLKKAMLQQLFVSDKNNLVPNIRFKGFMYAWKQQKLGDVGKTQSGIGFPNKEQGGQQGIPFFKVSDMNNNKNEFEMKDANNYVTETQITNRKWKPISEVPALIFAKVGAALMLNRKRLVNVPFLIDNNTMAYIFSKEWNPYFGKNLFDTLNLPRYAQTGALPSFNGSDIENIEVMLPSLKEQHVISQIFQNINYLITLHQRKIDTLYSLKKFCLQKMFI